MGRPKKKAPTRHYRRLYVIGVEGETEEAYFRSFVGRRATVKVVPKKGRSSNPLSVLSTVEAMLNESKRLGQLKPGDQAWVVVDRDQWQPEHLNQLFAWANERKDRGVGISSPNFEYWILLHADACRTVKDKNSLDVKLKTVLPGYQKNNANTFPITPDNLREAASRARRAVADMPESLEHAEEGRSAFTTVHFLVENLIRDLTND